MLSGEIELPNLPVGSQVPRGLQRLGLGEQGPASVTFPKYSLHLPLPAPTWAYFLPFVHLRVLGVFFGPSLFSYTPDKAFLLRASVIAQREQAEAWDSGDSQVQIHILLFTSGESCSKTLSLPETQFSIQ